MFKKRYLTTNNLLKKDWTENITCILFGVEKETMNYLFTRCVFTRFFMVTVLESIQPEKLGDDVRFVWVGR